MGEFGDKFRKAREKKELSLDDVSSVTKISPRMLQAIEEEQFDVLPGGVFNRGFIRAYAKHLGLNSEDAVNDYLSCLRQEQVDSHAGWDRVEPRRDVKTSFTIQPAATKPAATKSAEARPAKPAQKIESPVEVEELPDLQLPRIEDLRRPKREYLGWRPSAEIPWMRIAIVICLFATAFFVWTRYSRKTLTSAATTAQSVPSTVSAATPQAAPTPTQPTPIPTQVTPSPASSEPPVAIPAPASQPSTASSQDSGATPDSASSKPVAKPEPEASADPNAVKVQKKGDVTIRSFGAAPTKPVEKSTTRLTLIVRASASTWISVTSDGQHVTQETLIAPAATSFHATQEFVVRVGNAAGVSFLFNGQEFPPQGGEAEARTFVFDSQGMHPVITATPPAAPQP